MKLFLISLLFTFNVEASLPPTQSRGSNESSYGTTFKFNWGTLPITRNGTEITFGTLPVSGGGTGLTSFNQYSLLAGSGTAINEITAGASGTLLFGSNDFPVFRFLENSDVVSALGYTPVQSGTVVYGITAVDPITITGTISSPIVNLTSGGVASGTYTKIGVNEFGLVSSGTSLVESDIPSLQTTKITSGIFGIARGGTGLGSVGASGTVLTSNGTDLVYAASTGGSGVVESVSATSPLSITGTVSNPVVNFTGVLPIANGGTNLSTVGSSNTVLTSNGSSLVYAPVTATAGPLSVSTTSVNATLTTSIDVMLASGSVTLTLPTAVGNTGEVFSIKNISARPTNNGASNAVVLIQTVSSQLIDGVSASTSLVNYGESLEIVSDGTGWYYTDQDARTRRFAVNWGGASKFTQCGATPCTVYENTGAVSAVINPGGVTGLYEIQFLRQTCRLSAVCTIITADNTNFSSAIPNSTTSSTAYRFNTGTGAANNGWGSIQCSCDRW